jgi:SulP family sulfate permease
MKITTDAEHVRIFPRVDDALSWVEDRILGIDRQAHLDQPLLDLHEMELFKGRKPETISALEVCLQTRSCKQGEKIYSVGEAGDILYLIRRGSVRIIVPSASSGMADHHLATYGRGDFFGGLSFLDGQPRANQAVAQTDTELFALRRQDFDRLGDEHKKLAISLIEAIAHVLVVRLRYSDMELSDMRS